MKKRRQIKVGSQLYWLHCYPNGSDSNYNHAVCVQEVGELMPIAGTTMKQTDKLERFIPWGKESINQYLESENLALNCKKQP
jgi:hypothetical protein